MPIFRIRLTVPVTVAASTEFPLEAENYEQACGKALEEYKRLDKEYQEQLRIYRVRGTIGLYPKARFYWSVDSEDVEQNIDDDEIEVDTVTEED